MAKEPAGYGFAKQKAQTLSRIADREGLAPRAGGSARYPKPGTGEKVWLGKADANIASGASGTVSIWRGTPGSEADTGDNLTAFNRTGLQCDSTKWVKVLEIAGELYVFPLECPA